MVAIAHLFRDFGVNQYLIQEHELTREKISAAFTLTLTTSWILGLTIFLLATPAARFFGEPGVKLLISLLSINFFIIPFGSITIAFLRKNLRFEVTAIIGFVASFVGVITSVTTALQGASYMCLAYGSIAECLCLVALSVAARPPDLQFGIGLKGARGIFKFASTVGAGNIISRIGTSGTDAIIARAIGINDLGYFSRATGTFSLFERIFISSVNGIVLPLFSKNRMDLTKLQENYLKSVNYTLAFSWPFFAFLIMYTDDVILVLYGSQWESAVPLVKALSIAGFILPIVLFIDSLFISISRPDVALYISLMTNISKLILISFAAWTWGLYAAITALAASFFIKAAISCVLLKVVLGLKLRLLIHCGLKTLPLLLGTILPPILIVSSEILVSDSPFFRILILAFASGVGWLASLLISKHPFSYEMIAAYRSIPYINRWLP